MARHNVTIDLGRIPSVAGLASRRLIITEMQRAGVDTAPTAAYDQTLSGSLDSVVVALRTNRMWQAKLIDTKTSGEVRPTQVCNFHTGALQFPGPRSEIDSFGVYAMEDLSSSSDSSLNSSSSSSESSSTSSSTSSSVSSASSESSSTSSVSTSSSLNSSSSSASSLNSSSSSSSSLNSSSSSSSVSSSSSSSSSSESSSNSSSSSGSSSSSS